MYGVTQCITYKVCYIKTTNIANIIGNTLCRNFKLFSMLYWNLIWRAQTFNQSLHIY